MFERQRERERERASMRTHESTSRRGAEREDIESEQAPGSELSVRRLTQGLNPANHEIMT